METVPAVGPERVEVPVVGAGPVRGDGLRGGGDGHGEAGGDDRAGHAGRDQGLDRPVPARFRRRRAKLSNMLHSFVRGEAWWARRARCARQRVDIPCDGTSITLSTPVCSEVAVPGTPARRNKPFRFVGSRTKVSLRPRRTTPGWARARRRAARRLSESQHAEDQERGIQPYRAPDAPPSLTPRSIACATAHRPSPSGATPIEPSTVGVRRRRRRRSRPSRRRGTGPADRPAGPWRGRRTRSASRPRRRRALRRAAAPRRAHRPRWSREAASRRTPGCPERAATARSSRTGPPGRRRPRARRRHQPADRRDGSRGERRDERTGRSADGHGSVPRRTTATVTSATTHPYVTPHAHPGRASSGYPAVPTAAAAQPAAITANHTASARGTAPVRVARSGGSSSPARTPRNVIAARTSSPRTPPRPGPATPRA